MIPIENIIARCSANCKKHDVLLRNFFDSLAEMALHLHDRNDCLIKLKVREKVLTYLIRQSKLKGSNTFSIPFDRSAMADYLNVERTSCNEPYDVDKLMNDEILQVAKTLDLVKNTDDDTIEEIPAPIFFDLFN